MQRCLGLKGWISKEGSVNTILVLHLLSYDIAINYYDHLGFLSNKPLEIIWVAIVAPTCASGLKTCDRPNSTDTFYSSHYFSYFFIRHFEYTFCIRLG